MTLIQIDVVRLQSAQRKVDLLVHLLRRQSFAGPVSDWKPELRAENVGVPRALRQHLPEKKLSDAPPEYAFAVSMKLMPHAKAVSMHARPCSSEIAPPYVFQLPGLTAEMCRSLEPSRR